jgi:polar amino acid transport system substrate-binding protein
VLRAGINLSNFLLVSGTSAGGEPVGVSPTLASALGAALDLPIRLVALAEPTEVVAALEAGQVDVGNIGADPGRAGRLAFTAPYCEIEATFLVRGEAPIRSVDEVDRPGVRIASKQGAAYTLWLDRNLSRAEVVHTGTIDQSFELFVGEGLEVLAGLRPRLFDDALRLPGSRLLDGGFTSVQQAVGIRADRGPAALSYLDRFVEWAISSGLVASAIRRHRVKGLSVAGLQSQAGTALNRPPPSA